MIFGILDDGQVVGLEEPEGDAEKISEIVKSRLDPIPEFKLKFHKTGGAVDALDDAEYSGSIISLIRTDSKISTEKIAIALGVNSKTIKRHIEEMDYVNYVGRGFSGHWEIKNELSNNGNLL